jgi:hypothetical protein
MSRDGTDTIPSVPLTLARRAWTLYEPIHAIVYFAPEVTETYKAAGLRGGWMGYFASRSAPMGAVGAEVVTAVFHNFKPAMVARAIPDAWTFSSPERVLEARWSVADSALRRLWGDAVHSADVAEAAASALELARGLDAGGRPLFAGTAGLSVPEAPHLALWHACTLLREHRFDGHIAALTVHGLSGIEALITIVASGSGVDAAAYRTFRGWTEEEWAQAEQGLRDRGLIDAASSLTAEGRALREGVEQMTDRLAARVWDAMDEAASERLLGVLGGLARKLEGPGGLSYPNPVGVPRPA